MASLAFAALLTASPASAQAPQTSPETPRLAKKESLSDKARRIAKETKIVERLNGSIDGWYPRLGGMPTGGGVALGPGYHTHLGGERILLDVSATVSHRAYKAADFKTRWIQAWQSRVELWTNLRLQDFPEEDFFGIGLESNNSGRTSYRLKSADLSAVALVHLRPWLRVGLDAGIFNPKITHGADAALPSIEEFYNDSQAPGLASQPHFDHSTLFTEIDYRDEHGNPRSGGYYKASFGVWNDRGLDQFDFRRFDGEASQFVPIVTKNHVIAGRLGVSYVNNADGDRVPFYVLPYVGGSDTLRGYREFRFKDENVFWVNLEYRWAAMKYINFAVFADAGEVRHNWEEIGFGGLKSSYGVGVRFNTAKRVFARIDVAYGDEGRQAYLKFGPSF